MARSSGRICTCFLAVAHSVRHWLDGRESLHRRAHALYGMVLLMAAIAYCFYNVRSCRAWPRLTDRCCARIGLESQLSPLL